MTDTNPTTPAGTPAEIAASLSNAARRILRDACLPIRNRDTFPGPLNPDLETLTKAGLVVSVGYTPEATPLGRLVREAMSDD